MMGLPFWIIINPIWKCIVSARTSKHTFKYVYANKVSRAAMHFMSSQDLCSTSFHLNVSLYDVSAVSGRSKCDRMGRT